ncbi:ribosome maturation factor RimP [Longispora albida]|uniref:ribosome maturation factor RimP n=1 Tax=Longispora albida TaxID=203523 RepID=UPI00035CE2EF|nr:ribosome maturation factor RimP [Longispora albida]
MASLTALKTRMTEIAGPIIVGQGYDLEDLAVTRVGRRLLVRITVDGDDGVNLDTVAELSRLVAEGLDAVEDQLGTEPYTLEVSSPGIDRALTEERHWRRAAGRLVKSSAGTGRVVSAADGVVTLDFDGTEKQIGLAELGPGKIQIEFNRVSEAFPDAGDDEDLDEDIEEDQE